MMIVYISCGFFSLLCSFFISLSFSLSSRRNCCGAVQTTARFLQCEQLWFLDCLGGGIEWKWRYLLSNCVCVFSESMWTLNAYILFISRYILVLFFSSHFISSVVHFISCICFPPSYIFLFKSCCCCFVLLNRSSVCVSLVYQLTVYTFMLTHFNVSWW